MLEGQLERARKDIVALKRKLDSRPAAALHPALLRAAQVRLLRMQLLSLLLDTGYCRRSLNIMKRRRVSSCNVFSGCMQLWCCSN